VPSAQLALDVSLLAAQVAESDPIGIDGVQVGQHVHQ
jgi:hypothetical protein